LVILFNQIYIMQRIYLLFPILLFAFAACKKSNSGGSAMSISEYPLKVNNQWTYKVTDSMTNITDTAVLKITSNHTKDDTTWWYCKMYYHNMLVDSPYYVQTSNTIQFINNAYSFLSADFMIDFPVSNNNTWMASTLSQDTAVAKLLTSPLIVAGRGYSNVYMISRGFSLIDYNFRQNIYVSKGVGLIAEDYAIMPFGPQIKKHIELISYSLN